jgi:TPR repeat protein
MAQTHSRHPQAVDRIINAARHGDLEAYFELGVTFSTGANGVDLDLVQAHKWFNLAALRGSSEGQYCRAEIAREMSRADIAEAQRQARAWLSSADTDMKPPVSRH